jgi:hypothetical protein
MVKSWCRRQIDGFDGATGMLFGKVGAEYEIYKLIKAHFDTDEWRAEAKKKGNKITNIAVRWVPSTDIVRPDNCPPVAPILAHRSLDGPQKGKWRGLRALYSFKFGGERVETRVLPCWCAACVHNAHAGPGADAADLYACRYGRGALLWEMARAAGSGAAAAGGGGSGSGSESDGTGWVGSEDEEDEPALAPAPERDGSNYVASCCGCLLKRAVATPWRPGDEDFYCGYLQGCKCGEPSMEAV